MWYSVSGYSALYPSAGWSTTRTMEQWFMVSVGLLYFEPLSLHAIKIPNFHNILQGIGACSPIARHNSGNHCKAVHTLYSLMIRASVFYRNQIMIFVFSVIFSSRKSGVQILQYFAKKKIILYLHWKFTNHVNKNLHLLIQLGLHPNIISTETKLNWITEASTILWAMCN